MKLSRNELRKIQYDFNSYSNRLLQADYRDYSGVLSKFLMFIDGTPIIFDYIKSFGKCDLNLEEEVKKIQTPYKGDVFTTGDTEEEEVRNVYTILHKLSDANNLIYHSVARGYSTSTNYQDKIKGFNDRFVMILIRYIEGYLTKVGIDMGLDDKAVYNVTVHNGQVIIASDGSTVTAANNVGIDVSELTKLIEDVRVNSKTLELKDQETVSEWLSTIESEVVAERPKKKVIETAIKTLEAIKGTVEFVATVATLAEFVTKIL